MTGIDPLRLGREGQPPYRTADGSPPERVAPRVAPPAALPPPAAAGAGEARAPSRAAPTNLGALILAFAAPRDFDRRLLQPDRLQAILGETLAGLEQADAADDIAGIAAAAVAEELARHMALARICATEAPLPAAELALP